MAKLHDNTEDIIDESMHFIFDRLGDLSQLKKHGCLTVAQCALLLCLHNNTEKPDRSEDAATYIMLALHDIKLGKLQAIHPETLIAWAEYMNMLQAGAYNSDNELDAPMVTVGWLVRLDECEKWYRSKGLGIDLSAVKSDLEVIKTEITPAKRPLLQQTFQENEILRVIQELGYKPKFLPINKPGKKGVKSEVRAKLGFSTSIFDKAWERLSINKAIQYPEQ